MGSASEATNLIVSQSRIELILSCSLSSVSGQHPVLRSGRSSFDGTHERLRDPELAA